MAADRSKREVTPGIASDPLLLPSGNHASDKRKTGSSIATVSRELRESDERIRALVELTGQLLWTTPPDGSVTDMPYWRAFTGQSLDDVRNLGWIEAIHPDDREAVRANWAESIAHGTLFEMEYRLRRRDGVYRYFLVRAVPVREPSGEIREWVGVHTDITDRKKLEDELAHVAMESAARTAEQEATIEAIADAIFVFDRNGNLTRLNRAAEALYNLEEHPALAGSSVSERVAFLRPEDEDGNQLPMEALPVMRALRGEEFHGDASAEVIINFPNGRRLYLSESGAPLRDASGAITGAIVVARDVTARRRVEQRTRAALDAIVAIAETLVVSDETDEMDVAATRTAKHIAELTRTVLGCSRVSISTYDPDTGHSEPLTVVGMKPEDEAHWWKEQRERAQQPPAQDDATRSVFARLAAGEVIVIDVTKPPFDQMPNPYNITTMAVAPMRVGGKLAGNIALDHSGKPHRYTEEELAVAATIAQLAAVVIERARLVRERQAAIANGIALREANRRMDEFLSVASHELRTPLTTIRANVQLAERRLHSLVQDQRLSGMTERFESLHTLLARADRQTELINRLVGDLLDVSRIQANRLEMRRELCDLVPIVREAVHEQQLAWPDRGITLHAPNEAAMVNADPDRIGQVATNFLTNALKYSEETKPVEVEITIKHARVRVTVTDHGPGLPPEEHARIWERFHTAPGIEVKSGAGVGLGLGLYITRTIIDRHHGEVGVESAVGKGSTFWFELPLADAGEAE